MGTAACQTCRAHGTVSQRSTTASHCRPALHLPSVLRGCQHAAQHISACLPAFLACLASSQALTPLGVPFR